MGGSSKQVTGYQYFANFLLFIGNPIEKLLGINFDKRGWLSPLVDEAGNALETGTINKPSLYGENEGGVAGQIHARYGTANPMSVSFYTDYLAENDLPPLAYPFQSYLAFTGISFSENGSLLDLLNGNYGGGFYLGNSGYMKEMLLWPKRIHVKNDGSPQWYDAKSEIINKDKNSSSYFNGVFPSLNISLTRKQGIDSAIETYTVTLLSSVLIQNKPHTLKLWSERGGYSSYQTFEHAFFVESASLILTATATKSQVSGNTVHDANITVNVDEFLKANMKFDGSSISGKAPAGSTITIEIQE